MFGEVDELTFVSFLALDQYAEALNLVITPLPDIWYLVLGFPLATTVFLVVKPLAVVNLAVGPLEPAFSVLFVVEVVAQEEGAIGIELVALTTFHPWLKLTLEQFAWSVENHSQPMKLILLISLPETSPFFCLYNLKTLSLNSTTTN